MSYGDTPVSKNTVSITLKTLPGVEWMEIFVQFKIEPDTVVEDVIYFEYLSPDYCKPYVPLKILSVRFFVITIPV